MNQWLSDTVYNKINPTFKAVKNWSASNRYLYMWVED